MAAAAPQFSLRVKAIRDKQTKSTVMFIGAPGAGKSSLINSLVNVVDSSDETSQQDLDKYVATAPPDLMGGHTMMREAIQLTDSITIIDNRGWQDWGSDVALGELAAQINGERPIADQVDWEHGGKVYKKVTGMPLVVAEKITCVAVVINGKGGVDALQDFKKLIRKCNTDTGRIPTVVVTHKDEMSDEELERIQYELERVYGITKGRIFIIRNITETNLCIDDESKSRLLDFLDRCVADAKKATKFHEEKEGILEKILESQKQVEAEEKEKQKVEEAEAAAREVAAVTQEVAVEKLVQEKVRLKIDTNKQKMMAEMEESAKREEQKHAQNMNREKEEIYVKMQETELAHTVEEHKIKTQKESTLAQIEQDKKRDELDFSMQMNQLKLKSAHAAQDRVDANNEMVSERRMRFLQIEEEKERDKLKHQQLMHEDIQKNWRKMEESRQDKFAANLASDAFFKELFSRGDSD